MLDSIVGLQPTHLMSNAPMKLLTIIAAVLISISAYSQDYVEYDKGTFTQNGEQLSMEQIDDLTKRYNVGEWNLRKAKKCLRLAQKSNLGFIRNSLNSLGGAATGFVSLGGFVLDEDFLTDDGPGFLEFYHPPTGYALMALGTVSGSTAIYLFSNIGNKQAFELRAIKQFKMVADKLNQAIAPEEPTAQPPNQFRGAVIIKTSN